MANNSDDSDLGGYFSRNYLATTTPSSDDVRARKRVSTFLANYSGASGPDLGVFIESELGITCLKKGTYSPYVDWESFIPKLTIADFLDVITAISKHSPRRELRDGTRREVQDFVAFARRVFDEQKLAYRIDEFGGVHPLIDAHFSIASASLLRGLSDGKLIAAQQHVELAEKFLLASSFDGRGAIRAIFDAAENILKQINPKSTQLNKDAVLTVLRPAILAAQGNSNAEQRAAGKMIESLADWVEAAHFYRHETGAPLPDQPSHPFVISFVSQGMAFVRWIADAYLKRSALP